MKKRFWAVLSLIAIASFLATTAFTAPVAPKTANVTAQVTIVQVALQCEPGFVLTHVGEQWVCVPKPNVCLQPGHKNDPECETDYHRLHIPHPGSG